MAEFISMDLETSPDHSLSEIQEELDLVTAMLNSTDESADYYAASKDDYTKKIRQLESWIAQKAHSSRSDTPAHGNADNTTNFDLPSRDRGAGMADSSLHPSAAHVQSFSPSHAAESRKRRRENTTSGGTRDLRKARRVSDSSSIGTPSALSDSEDEASKIFKREMERKRSLDRRLEEDRQRELERYRQMKRQIDEDAKLAQRLFQGDDEDIVSPRPSKPAGNAYMSQATIGTNGGYRRRSISPPASRAMQNPQLPQHHAQSPPNTNSPTLSFGYRASNRDFTPAQARHTPAAQYPPVAQPQHSNAATLNSVPNPSDMFPYNSQHRASNYGPYGVTTSRLPNYGNGIRPSDPGLPTFTMPGAFPDPFAPSQYRPLSVPRPGQSMYESGVSAALGPHNRRYDWLSNVVQETTSFFEGGHKPSKATYGGYIDSDDDDSGDGFLRRSRYTRPPAGVGGEGYGFADNKQTQEDIEKLLANIRPDEELEEEAREETPDEMSVTLMKHQRLGLTWLKQQEEGSNKGAILADDMGLGKTIQAISLIVARPSADRLVKTTLIVCPVALMKQWEREVHDKLKPQKQLRVFVYHGQKKARYSKLASFDVVITTIGKLGSELKKGAELDKKIRMNPQYRPTEKDELSLIGHRCQWYRVIIDEAQSIKNHNTRGARAAKHLNAVHRLCMTGTPMMNNVKELWSLIDFLQIPPYNEWDKFRNDIETPLSGKRGPKARERGMGCLQALLKAILLRRTKKSMIDGQPILRDLPPRTTEVDHATFDPEQDAFYRALEGRAQLRVNRYLKQGMTVKNYAYILVQLLRLRQACCHPHLIKDFDSVEGSETTTDQMEELARQLGEDKVRMIKEADDAFECPICMDGTENPTIFFPCGHDVCAECFTRLTDPNQLAAGEDDVFRARCPECRADVNPVRVLSYNIFKKVHMLERYMDGQLGGAMPAEEAEASGESSEGSEDDSDSEGDDTTSQGDLRLFIVPDEEEEEEEAAETESDDEEKPKLEEERDLEDAEFAPARVTSSAKSKSKSKSSAASLEKNKGKGKGKKKSGSRKSNVDGDDNDGAKGANPRQKKKKKQTLADLKKESLRNTAARTKYLKRLDKEYEPSAKIDKMMELITGVFEQDPTEKIIIFSQFTSFLDLVEIPMFRQGLNYRRYDGSMKPSDRDANVLDFASDPDIRVMLISLKAGNAGLNLNCASQVIIVRRCPCLDDAQIAHTSDSSIHSGTRSSKSRRLIARTASVRRAKSRSIVSWWRIRSKTASLLCRRRSVR